MTTITGHTTTNPLRRIVAVALLTIASVAAVSGLSVSEASAHTGSGNATPINNSNHPWTSDGCSWVPDWGFSLVGGAFFNFNHACIHHDGCYRGHWASKSTCDTWFKNDMYASCATIWPWGTFRWSCQRQADIYYAGVTRLGGPAWVAWSDQIQMA